MKSFILSLFLCLMMVGNAFADTGWVYQPSYTQGTNNPSATSTAGHKGDLYFNNTNKSVFIKTDDFITTNWFPVTGNNAAQYYFSRTCSITSAAAATAVHCLLAGDVGATQSAYLTGFHAYVNGGTNWATTTSCTIQDTNASPVAFASIATTAMTANTFISTSTSGVTLDSAFYLNTGGTAGAGINLICNANGTGSTFYVIMDGYLH